MDVVVESDVVGTSIRTLSGASGLAASQLDAGRRPQVLRTAADPQRIASLTGEAGG